MRACVCVTFFFTKSHFIHIEDLNLHLQAGVIQLLLFFEHLKLRIRYFFSSLECVYVCKYIHFSSTGHCFAMGVTFGFLYLYSDLIL